MAKFRAFLLISMLLRTKDGAMAIAGNAEINRLTPVVTTVATPLTLAAANSSNVLYVAKSGNDTTAQRDSLTFPFLTIAAAKAAAVAGDTIMVMPGTYPENDLLKNNVNYSFAPGANVLFSDIDTNALLLSTNRPTDPAWGIFDDRTTGSVTSNIEGDTFRFYSINSRAGGLLVVTNAASRIRIKANMLDCSTYAGRVQGGLFIRSAVNVMSCSNVMVDVDEINDQRGTFGVLAYDEDDLPVTNAATSGTVGVFWMTGQLHVHSKRLSTPHNYAIWCDDRTAAEGITPSADFWYNGDLIEGAIYTSTTCNNAANWRGWFEVKQVLGGNANATAAVGFYGGGKWYLLSEKVHHHANDLVVHDGATAWVTVQKMTSDGQSPVTGTLGSWITLISSDGVKSPTCYADVSEFEDGGNLACGFDIGNFPGRAGNLFLRGSNAKIFNGTVLKHNGGHVDVQGLRMENVSGGAPVVVLHSGLVLRNCLLVGPSGTNSITATSAQTVAVYGTAARTSKHGNITLSPNGGFTVNPNVQ